MPKYVRVGNRILNLELVVSAQFVPPNSDINKGVLTLHFLNPDAMLVLFSDEADRVWHLLNSGALNITPRQTSNSEAIAT